MSRFLNDANEIFQAASAVAGEAESALTILIHPQGQIHIVDGAEAPIDSLQAQHGCGTAFRVTRGSGAVRVEGRNGSNRCILENAGLARKAFSPAETLGLFRDVPLYSVSTTLALR